MMTSFDEFRSFLGRGNVIPIYEELLADTETPVSVYMKIRSESPYSFLFESVEGGEKLARYSFLGLKPFMLFKVQGKRYTVEILDGNFQFVANRVKTEREVLPALKKIFSHFQTVPLKDLPRFSGGAVGYFGYETIQLLEQIPQVKLDDLRLADLVLMFFNTLLVFDNIKRKIFIIFNVYLQSENLSDAQQKKEYQKAVEKIKEIRSYLKKQTMPELSKAQVNGQLCFTLSKEDFLDKVNRCKEYIVNGDIFQVVFSQRLDQELLANAFDLYRMLRIINPSPYLYYLNIDDLKIIGSSPEMLVRVENRLVETRPIAGTRPRGTSPEEDEKLSKELFNDEKELAEHLMLVDLGRNDIGRISDFGTVEVNQFMILEKYSHVMHIVSSVRGRLRKDLTAIDALYSCFPAGTLTGAPKIRAMEIIAELEPTKRGVYGGAIGYIDFSGNLDSCIAIRTIVVKGNKAYFQAGAGIVADSIPEREYQETLDKLSANLKAVELLMNYP